MNNFLIALLIGLCAGVIDIIPMIIQKLKLSDTLSAFVHYFVLGLIIPFVNWGIPTWLSGIVISLATAIPIMIIVFKTDKKALIPMMVFSILLGAGIGWAGAKFMA